MIDYGSASFDSTSNNIIRSGTVVDRQLTTSGAQVRVVYPDRDGVTSDWLPVGQKGSVGTVFHYCPRVGDNVLVANLPSGIEMGTVIATNCTANNPSFQPRSLNALAIMADDGAYFEHDPDVSCLSINGLATIYVNASGQIVIIAGGDIDVTTNANCNLTVSGNLTANVTGNATVTAANVTINASSSITLNSPIVSVSGILEVDNIAPYKSGNTLATPHVQNADGLGGNY